MQKRPDPKPYRSTPVFDQATLPQALRSRHNTKAGVWGVIRMIEGELLYTCLDPAGETLLSPAVFMVVEPQQPHFVTPVGPMKMQVDFYDERPVAIQTTVGVNPGPSGRPYP